MIDKPSHFRNELPIQKLEEIINLNPTYKRFNIQELSDLLRQPTISLNGFIPEVENYTLTELEHPIFHDPIKIGIVKAFTRNTGSSVDNIASSILGAVKSQDYHIVIAPEYNFLHSTGPLSVTEMKDYVDQFKEASKNGTLIIPGTFVWESNGEMSNTSYVFYNGEITFQYDKMNDGGELSIAKRHGLTPKYGSKLGTFEWEGLKLGIEICADGGKLSGRGIHDRDLLFLISCGNSILSGSMGAVRKGGYGVVADGFAGVYKTSHQTQEPNVISFNSEGVLTINGSMIEGFIPRGDLSKLKDSISGIKHLTHTQNYLKNDQLSKYVKLNNTYTNFKDLKISEGIH